MIFNKLHLYAATLSVCCMQTLAQSNENNSISYFNDGEIGVNMDDMYFLVTSALHQNATQHICFVDGFFPPPDGMCPESGKFSLDECRSKCETEYGAPSLTSCPINQAGCCECPFFSFHVNDVNAGNLYDMSPTASNPAWTGVPGWFNLAVWVGLFIAIMFLLVTMYPTMHRLFAETRSKVIWSCRAVGFVGMNMFAMWCIVYLLGMNAIGHQNYYPFSLTAAGLFTHVLFGAIWMIAGALQFVGPLRRRWPRAHRSIGWITVVSSVISTIGLFILILVPHISGLAGTILSFIFGVYWNAALGIGVYYAVKRDINAHRRWMTRHMFMGCSIIFQRAFNVAVVIFKSTPYYVGAFYEAACSDPGSITAVTISSASAAGVEPDVFLNADQMVFACTGIDGLFTQMTKTFEFFLTFTLVGLFACELWLWVRGLQSSQQCNSLADSVIKVQPSEGNQAISVLRQVEQEIEVTLVEKEAIAEDAFKLRFAFANENESLLVPLLGHVNLRKQGMLRSRPYSPVHALEPGFITFFIRRVQGGLLSTHMTQEMNVGDTIFLSGPAAPVPTPYYKEAKNILMVGGGTGIAPFLSMLESTNANCRVLVRDSSKARSIGVKGRELGENVNVELFCKEREELYQRLDELISPKVAADKDSQFGAILVCGPASFNIAVKSHVGRSGIPTFAIGTDDR